MWSILDELQKQSKAQNIQLTKNNKATTDEILRKIFINYFGECNNPVLWKNIKKCTSVQNDTSWRWIANFVSDSECVMFFNLNEEEASVRFSCGNDVLVILEETYGFEFYITNKNAEYLLCFNHHNFLIACGSAEDWLSSYKNGVDSAQITQERVSPTSLPALPYIPLTYPIYIARTYPDQKGEIIVYSVGFNEDNLFAKFVINSITHRPYRINTEENINEETYQIVLKYLQEVVVTNPDNKYPQSLVIGQDGIIDVVLDLG